MATLFIWLFILLRTSISNLIHEEQTKRQNVKINNTQEESRACLYASRSSNPSSWKGCNTKSHLTTAMLVTVASSNNKSNVFMLAKHNRKTSDYSRRHKFGVCTKSKIGSKIDCLWLVWWNLEFLSLQFQISNIKM